MRRGRKTNAEQVATNPLAAGSLGGTTFLALGVNIPTAWSPP